MLAPWSGYIRMSASRIRGKILGVLWATGKPMGLEEIAKKIGINPSSTMGYLLGLIKAKYVSVPRKHYYEITSLGKEALGLPKIDTKLASTILSSLPLEKAFHFHTKTDQYSGVYADSLKDFADKIEKIDLKAIEFHLPRRDFELWIHDLGDIELSRKIGLIRRASLSGDDLRKEVYETVKSRYEALIKLSL